MVYEVYDTNEKYDCPDNLYAKVKRFESVQCGVNACGGNRDNLEKKCRLCDNYINNRIAEDAKCYS